MAGFANYDYDIDAANLQRRMQLADAMMQGSLAPMGPTETVGGYAVKRSPIEALAKVAQAYLAGSQQNNIVNQQKELGARYRGDLQSGVQQLMEGLNAHSGQAVPAVEGNNPSAYTPPSVMTPEDAQAAKRSAILNAVGSNVPALQGIGMNFLNQIGKDYMTTNDWLKLGDKYTADSIIHAQQTGDPRYLVAKPQFHTVGDQLVPTQDTTVGKVAFDGRHQYSGVEPVATSPTGTPIMGQKDKNTGEVKFAPPGTQITVDNSPQKAADRFATGIAGARADAITKSFETAKDLPAQLNAVKEAQGLLQQGIVSGSGADVSLALQKIGQKLGIPGADDPKATNTEAFRASLANTVLEKIKVLRPASDQDVRYAKEASGADVNLALPSLQRLLLSHEAAIYNTYLKHEDLLSKASGGQGALPEDLAMFNVDLPIHTDQLQFQPGSKPGEGGAPHGGQFVLPPAPKSATAATPGNPSGQGVMSLDDYLNSKRRK